MSEESHRVRFAGKHVLITGGARGIGLEIASQFAREKAIISLFDTHRQNLAAAAEKIAATGIKVYTYQVDVSNRQQVLEAVERVEATAPIDVLINNAGIGRETPFLEITEKEWKEILDVNLTGMFYVAQAVCRYMYSRKKGVVVNMGSKNGLDGEYGYAHYNASKGGVIMLTKTMALEFAHIGIRVNAVCPGYIQTPMSMEIDPPEFTQQFVDKYIPLNRAGSVEEVAPAFLFLASEESSFMTGQILILDGGQLAGQKPGNELLKK
ncbi:glucose 1-dehydrogenase [Rhodocytophaga rosea]|uniref:Glucose 1-dehydrogenase n=1 Tax=Rhodocytophaga rosea TaxID=2704465 RepID=A0A6C0GFR5_9BACT|nr:glucose 1-dehydrogenase [Rhodocytophaga rosea]QHT66846.1 glucose 1-dehydrogenase [Rhodocytophaga rosea]